MNRTQVIGRGERRPKDSYLERIRDFPLRVIRSDVEYQTASATMEKLAVRGEEDLESGELEYLDALGVLMEDYARRRYAPGKSTPLSVLKHLMAERGMNVSALGRVVGSQPAASLILSGRREISKGVARKLGTFFGVEAGVFI